MRINICKDETGRNGGVVEGNGQEYHTASELFDMMAKNHTFQDTGSDALTKSELVLLYKNIDLGTQLMSSATGHTPKKPNQYIETIVYNEGIDSDESDISEIISNENLHDVVLFNKERIELLNNPPSLENILCEKFGVSKIKTTDHSSPYDKYFLLKDPYILEQLNNLNSLNENDLLKVNNTVLPSSLLDYICCKRLEDNCNFYMDNVIKYVKQTIDQLKRISNGDYLTEKAKEKWKEVKEAEKDKKPKFLCASSSIPLPIERRKDKQVNSWDEIMRSEIDVRSLSKLLEKKIVVQIPRFISSSFRGTLFSKRCAENLVITCKKESNDKKDERLEVVLKLGKSKSGVITSKISSIMIKQSFPPTEQIGSNTMKPLLALTYVRNEDLKIKEIVAENNNRSKSEELISNSSNNNFCGESDYYSRSLSNSCQTFDRVDSYGNSDFVGDSTGDEEYGIPPETTLSDLMKDMAPFEVSSPNELRLTVQQLNVDEVLPEENWDEVSTKKKTSGKVRIKSPYENKSFAYEEKKRKKLLEIKQRREMRKQAHLENLKKSKQNFAKPQSTNSVTSLSITNKSFYNSIYGHAPINSSDKQKNCKWQKKDSVPKIIIDMSTDKNETQIESADRDNKKYIDRSFYLDDTISDMMMREKCNNNENKINDDSCFTPSVNSNIVSQVIGHADTNLDLISHQMYNDKDLEFIGPPNLQSITDNIQDKLNAIKSATVLVPSNSPKNIYLNDRSKELKNTINVDFKESIDKIYEIMHHKESFLQEKEHTKIEDNLKIKETSTRPASECGTSKHNFISTASSLRNLPNVDSVIDAVEMPNTLQTILPINKKPNCVNRAQMARLDGEKFINDRKKRLDLKNTFDSKNPLKAISMLIREFDDVTKPKSAQGKYNKTQMSQSIHQAPNTSSFPSPRRSPTRTELPMNERILSADKGTRKVKERILKSSPILEGSRANAPVVALTDKLMKKKMTDMIDEVKEARGEAVRGPCVMTSRLNSLAQPKKIYVQAHIEEQQIKARRNYAVDRPLKPVQHSRAAAAQENKTPVGRNRQKRLETVPLVKQSPSAPPIDRIAKVVERGSSPEKRRAGMSTINRRSIQDASETTRKKVLNNNAVKHEHVRSSSPSEIKKTARLRNPSNLQNVDTASTSSNQNLSTKQPPQPLSKLNLMVKSLLKYKALDLEELTEYTEPCVASPDPETVSLFEIASKNGSSVYEIDVLGDVNVITAIENTHSKDTLNGKQEPKIISKTDEDMDHIMQQCPEESYITISDSDVYDAFKNGLFNLQDLTPKSSLKNGDCSLILNLPQSHNDFATSTSENISVLKNMPVLSKTKLDWTFPSFPMQIATVGFAFPQYNFMANPSNPTVSITKLQEIGISRIIDHTLKNFIKLDKEGQHSRNSLLDTSKNSSRIIFTVSPVKSQSNNLDSNTKQEFNLRRMKDIIDLNDHNDKNTTKNNNNLCNTTRNDTIIEKEYQVISDPIDDCEKMTENGKAQDTTSLDMLVSVLNEIKKITACQSHIANPFSLPDNTHDIDSKGLENILDYDYMKHEYCDVTDPPSITIIKNFRKLESHSSTISEYIADYDKHDQHELNEERHIMIPDMVDKEVNADISNEIAIINNNDASSQCIPSTVAHTTNVTKSLFNLWMEPSKTSLFSLDFHTVSNESFQTPKLVELILEENVAEEKIRVRKEKNSEVMRKNNIVSKIENASTMCLKEDSTLKMKRDILVTVYSVLVFTVFAALSFPEVLYRL